MTDLTFSEENPSAKNVILSAMREWEQSSCLKFVRRTTEKDYIEFFQRRRVSVFPLSRLFLFSKDVHEAPRNSYTRE